MSHWNYRTFRKRCRKTSEIYFQIHEVYYNKDDEITAVSTKPVVPQGEDEKELQGDLTLMNLALDKPALVLEEIKFAEPDWALGYVGLDDFIFRPEINSERLRESMPEECRKYLEDPDYGSKYGIGWCKEHHWFVAQIGEKFHCKGGFPVKWSERKYEEQDHMDPDILFDMLPYIHWMKVCDQMPPECRAVIDEYIDWDGEDEHIPGNGIGWNEELGWFVTEVYDVGAPPDIIWQEKEDAETGSEGPVRRPGYGPKGLS